MGTVYAIGIDFGTANSCVAYATYQERAGGEVDPDPLHRPEVIPFHNRDTVPTAIHLGDGQTQPPTFGQTAEERGKVDPARFYTGFKLQLGSPDRGRDAYLMSRYYLGYVRKQVGKYVPLDRLGEGERIETIVGHPGQWSPDQREATLRAAQEAGFPNVRLEEESLAALYCHVFDERSGFRPRPGSYVMVIDMGAGTTDFAFLEIPKDPAQRPISIPVDPAPAERRTYGGRDVDVLLLKYLARHWDAAVVQAELHHLLREVKSFKEAFSNQLTDGAFEHESKIVVGDGAHRVRLTRDEFERLAGHYIAYFETLVRGALEESQLHPNQVSHLILTGGHSRWYFVERTLGQVFPHLYVTQGTVFRHSHPEQSVARGLAYDPLVRSSKGGFLEPRRRAAHPLWLQIPGTVESEPVMETFEARRLGKGPEPVLVLARGQLLPFRSETPHRFQVRLPVTGTETHVRVQLLSGRQRVPLGERIATFQRRGIEGVASALAGRLLGRDTPKVDDFEVEVSLDVSEHEIVTAAITVHRLSGGKIVDTQQQTVRLDVEAEMAHHQTPGGLANG